MIILFDGLCLALFHRRTAVTDDAAATLALLIIACKIFCEDLLRYKTIVYLNNCSVIRIYYFFVITYSTLLPFSSISSTFLTSAAFTASICPAYPVVRSFPSRYLNAIALVQ